jgi:hypothetical protein
VVRVEAWNSLSRNASAPSLKNSWGLAGVAQAAELA